MTLLKKQINELPLSPNYRLIHTDREAEYLVNKKTTLNNLENLQTKWAGDITESMIEEAIALVRYEISTNVNSAKLEVLSHGRRPNSFFYGTDLEGNISIREVGGL